MNQVETYTYTTLYIPRIELYLFLILSGSDFFPTSVDGFIQQKNLKLGCLSTGFESLR